MSNEIQPIPKIAVFKGMKIRKKIFNDEWYFSIVDVVKSLTDSSNPRRYWSDIKDKLTKDVGIIQLYEKIVQLKLQFKKMHKALRKIEMLPEQAER